MKDMKYNWNYSPRPGEQDGHPFTFDQLSWLQAMVHVQYVEKAAEGGTQDAIRGAVQAIAGTGGGIAPSSPGSYRTPSKAGELLQAMENNRREVFRRFIDDKATAKLQPGQSVILDVINVQEDPVSKAWLLGHHAVTLSNISGTFHIYNPEMTLLPDAAFAYLPKQMKSFKGVDLSGKHLSPMGSEKPEDIKNTMFGISIGLVQAEITAPFQVEPAASK